MLESHNAVIPISLLLIAETSMKTYFFWGLKVSHCAVRFQRLRTTSVFPIQDWDTLYVPTQEVPS